MQVFSRLLAFALGVLSIEIAIVWSVARMAHAEAACPATPFEKSNLFFPPKGMTLMTDVIDLFKQDTPSDERVFSLEGRDSFWRSIQVAGIMLAGGAEAQAT